MFKIFFIFSKLSRFVQMVNIFVIPTFFDLKLHHLYFRIKVHGLGDNVNQSFVLFY